jgi:SAM-dependent methyltransferase
VSDAQVRGRPSSVAESYEGQDLEALADIPNYQQWIVRHFIDRVAGRVLEVGAGIGSISRLYATAAGETVLIEPADNLTQRLRDNIGCIPSVRVFSGLLEDLTRSSSRPAGLSDESFDLAVMVNVLEHVDDDVALLGILRRLLRPGGSLFLFVPAHMWLFGSLDALVHHRRRYSTISLGDVVRQSGFAVETMRYFDVLGVVPWFVAGRVLRQRQFNARAAKLYDSLVVPIGAKLEGLVSPPVGKNVLCLARRPPS